MRFRFAIALLVSSLGLAWAQVPASRATRAVPLSALVDRNRPLLVFAPDDSDGRLAAQVRLLAAHRAELSDRQVLLLPMTAHSRTERTLLFSSSTEPGLVTEAEVASARARFHVAPGDFTVVLLGKDGGEKVRSSDPVSWPRLRDLIDAMPMRRQEMGQARRQTGPNV